jgi:hypothetical protein
LGIVELLLVRGNWAIKLATGEDGPTGWSYILMRAQETSLFHKVESGAI